MKLAFFIVAIVIIAAGIYVYLRKPKRKMPVGRVICMKKHHKTVSLIVNIVMLVLIVSMLFVRAKLFSIWMVILPNLFFAMAVILLLYSLKFKVILLPDRFSYYTMFGNRYDFEYSEIERIIVTSAAICIKVNKKWFLIEGSAKNAEAFLFRADMNRVPMKFKLPGAKEITFMRDQFDWLNEAGIRAKNPDDFEMLCALYGYLGFVADESDTLYAMSKFIDENGENRAISDDIFCIKLADERDIFSELTRIAKGESFENAVDDGGIVSFENKGEMHYIDGTEGDIRACIAAANECVSGERTFRANYMLSGALVIFATDEEAALLRRRFGAVFV